MSTQRYGLLGWPVKHSVSPQMQEAGFRAVHLDASYSLIPVPPEDVKAKVRELVADQYRGWNVTVPHKGAMHALVDTAEPAARHARSVNTVLVKEGQLVGYSTDGYGLEMAIQEAFGLSVKQHRFVFWGTGGAARATSIYFALEHAAAITLVNRTVDKAKDLAMKLREIAPTCQIEVFAMEDVEAIRPRLPEADVIFQCTSIGLNAEDPPAIPLDLLTSGQRLMDMIYHPTRLLQQAAAKGCTVADGRPMLLHQGARSFTLWTGKPAPVEIMRQALNQALDER